jgi:excisionase family DNA binding protein
MSATLLPERATRTLKEAAARLGVSTKTVTRESEAGRLKTVKIRGRRLVRIEDLEAYLASLNGSGN